MVAPPRNQAGDLRVDQAPSAAATRQRSSCVCCGSSGRPKEHTAVNGQFQLNLGAATAAQMVRVEVGVEEPAVPGERQQVLPQHPLHQPAGRRAKAMWLSATSLRADLLQSLMAVRMVRCRNAAPVGTPGRRKPWRPFCWNAASRSTSAVGIRFYRFRLGPRRTNLAAG